MSVINDNSNRNRVRFQNTNELKGNILNEELPYSERYNALHALYEKALFDWKKNCLALSECFLELQPKNENYCFKQDLAYFLSILGWIKGRYSLEFEGSNNLFPNSVRNECKFAVKFLDWI